MLFLLLNILSSTIIALVFKFIDNLKVNTFKVIVINYLVAASLGFLLNDAEIGIADIFRGTWVYLSVIIGVLFIAMLYLIAVSTQKAGITVTTISMRMSVVVPIGFSILFYQEEISSIKIIGIIVALVAVLLSVYKERSEKVKISFVILPIIIFLGAGLVDSLVKFSQEEFLDDAVIPIFSAILFSVSALIGLIITFTKPSELKYLINKKVLIWGILLGIANFGTVFFFINALNNAPLDSSVIFGINHIGIVSLSIVMALIIFKEKLNKVNWIGIILSLLSIITLSNA